MCAGLRGGDSNTRTACLPVMAIEPVSERGTLAWLKPGQQQEPGRQGGQQGGKSRQQADKAVSANRF
jgi:hypothetical protein